ncbi:hypothetical protein J2T07_002720 [Luteibacter jiangsuensis]|uniref:Uncharacterized protein n=1 Tax=Luteibacter jiangsuensis TaxID=637577 RepID=A0ABT9SZT9_9GAMM|nr:hypothetical protein [Luteibacter jiangsuensis]MDQ0010530.1 hypothetical protein [Luteibacter jiangsuensis]
MEQEKHDDISATLQRMAEEFSAKVSRYSEVSGLSNLQARKVLLAISGLRSTREKIRNLRGRADLPVSSDTESLFESLSIGQAFLAGGEREVDVAIERAEQDDFLAAFVATVHVVSDIAIALDFLASEERQSKASRAAVARHLVDNKRKEDAFELFLSREWKFKADAARAIERVFHVTYKTAERWISEWTRPIPPST